MKEYPNEELENNEATEELTPEVAKGGVPPVFLGLYRRHNFKALANEMIKAEVEAIKNPSPYNLAVRDTFYQCFNEMFAPKNGNKKLEGQERSRLYEFMQAVVQASQKHMMPAIKEYNNWETKLKNKEIEDTELYVTDPSYLRGLTTKLSINRSPEARFVSCAYKVYNTLSNILKKNERDIHGDGADVFANKWMDNLNEDFCKKNNISYKSYKKYYYAFNDIDSVSEYGGFKIKLSVDPNDKDYFEDIPDDLKLVKSLKTEEDVNNYVHSQKVQANKNNNYEETILNMARQAAEILDRLERTEEGHGKSATYKKMHDALKKFSEMNENSNVDVCFQELAKAAIIYEKDHTGITNIHRSNFGYGNVRLGISREIQRFVKTNINVMKNFGTIASTRKERDENIADDIEYVNAYLELKDRPQIDINEILPKREEEVLQRQNAIALDDYKAKNGKEMAKEIAIGIATHTLQEQARIYNREFVPDQKKIRSLANRLMANYCLEQKPLNELYKAVESPESIVEYGEKLRFDMYDIKNNQYDEYVNDMKELYKTLVPSNKHSEEYQTFVRVVEEASNLGKFTKTMTPEMKSKAFSNTNMKLINAIAEYTKGKERVRRSLEGQDCFNNNIDALAILSKYTKAEGMIGNQRVVNMIVNIQEKRGEKESINLKTLENDFGPKRSQQAEQARIARAGNQKKM